MDGQVRKTWGKGSGKGGDEGLLNKIEISHGD